MNILKPVMRLSKESTTFNKGRFFSDLGYTPHPGQREIHESQANRRVVACGVRWGKTLCAAVEGLATAMEPKERSMGWVVAPTYDLADKVYREMALLVARHLRHRIVTMKDNEKRLVIRNMAGGFSEIRGKSADNPISLLGEGLDWIIVDEAARLKPAIWEGHISQRLIDKHGWALLISTPRGKGWYYDLFRCGQGQDSDYQSWNHPSWSNPYLDKDLIELERDRLPERVFREQYGAEFIEGSGTVLLYVRDRATGTWQDPVPGESYCGGLDLAKIEDYTVLVIMNRQRQVVFADRFHKLDWSIQVNRIKAITDRFNHAMTFVDSTGAGGPVFESLRKAGVYARPYPFTQRSKAALVNNLSLIIEQGQIVLPRPDLWPVGIEELEAFEFSVTEEGNVRTGAPYGCRDDCVMGLALACWPLRPNRSVPTIS